MDTSRSGGSDRYPVSVATRTCVCTLRPSIASHLPVARAIDASARSRCTFEANIPTITRSRAADTIRRSASKTCRSVREVPGWSEFVESESRSATPSSPSARRRS
jgi:hypothetical protein